MDKEHKPIPELSDIPENTELTEALHVVGDVLSEMIPGITIPGTMVIFDQERHEEAPQHDENSQEHTK